MPRQRLDQRAQDRVLDLFEAGARVGYAPETLRQMMFRGPDPRPPLVKHPRTRRWQVRLADLDAWAIDQQLPIHPLPDEATA